MFSPQDPGGSLMKSQFAAGCSSAAPWFEVLDISGVEMGWLYKQRNKKSSSEGSPAIVVQREFGDFKREMEMKSVETPGGHRYEASS